MNFFLVAYVVLYGVFSDVHSNLEALTAVLAFFEKSGVEAHLCCGDLVGYGADPNECLDRVRGLERLSLVGGNHDFAVIGRFELDWFNLNARAAILWTRERLTESHRTFLETLSPRLETPEFTLVHGSPRSPFEEYLLSAGQFQDNAEFVSHWPLFVGHSHLPLMLRGGAGGRVEIDLFREGEHVLPRAPGGEVAPIAVNPGAVGQPRDQDPRASCALYDSQAGVVRLHRIPYDVAGAQAKIRAAGLPERLASRLALGQ